MKTGIEHINPKGMFHSPAFSQAVAVSGTGKTIYIGGQDAADENGETVGKGNLGKQVEQVMRNVQTLLKACDATFADVVKLNIYLLHGQDAGLAFKHAQPFMAESKEPMAVTVVFVSGFGNPDYLLEVDGIAFLPD